MLWSYSGFLLAYITSLVLAHLYKTQTCLKSKKNPVYTCEPNQMIHVISKLYQEASVDCEVPDDACEVTEDSLSNGFGTDCNGKVTCTEDLSLFNIKKTCENITAAMATTSHECITDPQVNVCSSQVSSIETHALYLISPNFPEESNAGNTDRACECDIKGTDLSVEILEIKFLNNPSMRANLTLTGDISSWGSYPDTFLAYNLKAINKTNGLHVMFHAYNRNSQRMWIRIKGMTNLTTQCNYVAPPPTSSSSTSRISSRLTSVTITTGTSIKSQTPAANPLSAITDIYTSTVPAEVVTPGSRNTSTIIGVLSGVIVILLVIAALVIYFKYVKPRRLSMSKSTERGDEAHYEYVTASRVGGQQVSGNDAQNTSDNIPADYADLRHYGNMDNVYTGLSAQRNQTIVSENLHSHLQTYASDNTPYECSDL